MSRRSFWLVFEGGAPPRVYMRPPPLGVNMVRFRLHVDYPTPAKDEDIVITLPTPEKPVLEWGPPEAWLPR